MNKKITALILALTMLITVIPIAAFADTSAKSGQFYYAGDLSEKYQETYYYDDNYFTQSTPEYNPSLATMSLCFSMSTNAQDGVNPEDYLYKYKNAEYLLTNELGFESFDKNEWYTKKPSADSIAAVIAKKQIDDNGEPYTLLAVGVRGFGYESEWASNVTIGKTGDAQGFSEAKEQVLDFINGYIQSEGITGGVKLWITGFSRAAAVSNLVAGEIDNNPKIFGNTVKIAPKDIFAYCFATPMGVEKAKELIMDEK